jgi:hypothetical protein
MPFFSGSTDMDALIDRIADDLLATGSWVTADGTLAAGAHPAKRAIKHAVDTTFHVTLDRAVSTVVSNGTKWFNEVRIRLSTSFDTGTHEPNGTVKTAGIPAEAWQTGFTGGTGYWAAGGTTGSGNKVGTVYLWTDLDGFTGIVTWNSAGGIDYTILFGLERNTAKEYADGFTNFFFHSFPNNNPTLDSTASAGGSGAYYGNRNEGSSGDVDLGRPYYVRPFSIESYSSDAESVERFFKSYRSAGNSKVYLQFPWYSNNTSLTQRNPIAQTTRWFWVHEAAGLADGDLIDVVVGAQTFTYLVKLLQSPDSINYAPYAVRKA